jgi:hypothetical protein
MKEKSQYFLVFIIFALVIGIIAGYTIKMGQEQERPVITTGVVKEFMLEDLLTGDIKGMSHSITGMTLSGELSIENYKSMIKELHLILIKRWIKTFKSGALTAKDMLRILFDCEDYLLEDTGTVMKNGLMTEEEYNDFTTEIINDITDTLTSSGIGSETTEEVKSNLKITAMQVVKPARI